MSSIIASQKRKENIAEYILYMWNVEDLIRANGLDIDRITHRLIDPANLSPEQRKEQIEWYESLIDMMRREGVADKGHLQMNKNIIGNLAQLNKEILADPRFDDYRKEYYKTLPYIVELRAKAKDEPVGEIETCFTALYGVLMMRLSGKEISAATAEAVAQIARFVAMLAKCFHLDEEDRLFTPQEKK